MYQILCDGVVIYDPRNDELTLNDKRCKIGSNICGEASFSILANHPHYDKLKKLRSVFEIKQDEDTIFRGRMTEESRDFDNMKVVDLEGAMAYLNDSVIRPFTFPDDFPGSTSAENIVESFFAWIIEQHNAQVQEFQRFKVGKVTVKDPNNYVARSNSGYSSAWATMKDKLFGSSLGGYLCVRYEADGNYLDYLADYVDESGNKLVNGQVVEYGKNLLDFTIESDGNETYSAVIPLGKKDEKTSTPLTISALPDGDITDDIVKKGIALYSKKAVAEYGWICAPTSESTFDDVTEAKNLRDWGVVFLEDGATNFLETTVFSAMDLHLTDDKIETFRVYKYVAAVSVPHGTSGVYPLSELDIDMDNLQNTKITVGETKGGLTDKTAATSQKIMEIERDYAPKEFVSQTGQEIESKLKEKLEDYTEKTEVQNVVNAYVDSDEGIARIRTALSGTYVGKDELTGYVKTTELNTTVEQYLNTEEGKASITSAVTGKFVTEDKLSGYLEKTELSTEIGQYIEGATGTAKIITACSATYQKKTDMSGYVTTSNLSTSVNQYLSSSQGKAQIESAVSGTFVTEDKLSGYVKTTELNTSIGQYIDGSTGTAKIDSIVSAKYQTKSGMSEYAKTSALSSITQSVSNVEAAITLSTTYSKNTIGTNVQALLSLVSNPNSSTIKIKADKIDFTGFTTFLKASDLGAGGSTTIDGGRITTGKISADRIEAGAVKSSKVYGSGTYSSTVLLESSGVDLYLGGTTSSVASSTVYITARSNIVIRGTTTTKGVCYDPASDSFYPLYAGAGLGGSTKAWGDTYIGHSGSYYWNISDACITPSSSYASSSYFKIGSSSYPINALYAKEIYVNGKSITGGSSGSSTTTTAGDFAGTAVKMGGSSSYYIQATTSRQLCPNTSSTYYAFYLGTSSYYWHYAYIGSVQSVIGSGTSSKLGFFGSTGATRQTVSSTATVATLITALKKYGLIY